MVWAIGDAGSLLDVECGVCQFRRFTPGCMSLFMYPYVLYVLTVCMGRSQGG
jgi:hypothetical protein